MRSHINPEHNPRLSWRALPQGWLAYDHCDHRAIVGVGQNFMRPWIYPLYTPSGHQVLQEFAFDHPFHNGCFIGWHPICHAGLDHNFWSTPPQRSEQDTMMKNLGRVLPISDPTLCANNSELQFQQNFSWTTESGLCLLNDQRSYRVKVSALANVVEITSLLQPMDQEVDLPATKFAGIGIRLDPRLSAAGNAWFEGDKGRGGASVVHESCSKFVRIECRQSERAFGLFIDAPTFDLPWFVRDYGLVLLNPVWQLGKTLRPGSALLQSARLIAYDTERSVSTEELIEISRTLD